MTIKEAYNGFVERLGAVYDLSEARSIARIVFEDALMAHDLQSKMPLLAIQEIELNKIQERLLQNEPIQYILGVADFYGLKFKVDRNVLIPRQETEELVFWILETIQKEIKNTAISILDIGTGSGCIPITLKKKMPQLNTSGIDISSNALRIAKLNAAFHKTMIEWVECDVLDKNQRQLLQFYDIIVSNPPYIPEQERTIMSDNVTKFEPELALFVSDDNPLLFYEIIADFAKEHLNPQGYLFFECNEFNALLVKKLLKNQGFKNVILQNDMNGKPRMLRGQL